MSGDGVSDLGAHLEEMDRMLRDIQVQLAPEREPPPLEPDLAPSGLAPRALAWAASPSPARPAAPPPAPPPGVRPGPPGAPGAPPADSGHRNRVLADMSAALLTSIRDLLDGYERLLTETAASLPSTVAPATEPSAPRATVSAGPFASTEALRQFEQAVSALRGVRDVTVRGYQGADRAIIEVRLDPPST